MPRPKNFDKEEVLDRAMRLFWRKGYEATSVQDLVAHTGVNKQSLYDTFGGKHALYLAALSKYRAENDDSLGELFAAKDDSVKETLQTMFDALISGVGAEADRKGCFMNNTTIELSPHNAEISKLCADNMKATERKFYQLIKRGQTTGEIRNSLDARAVAAFLFTAINGLQAISKITADKRKLKGIVKTTLSILD